MTTILKNPLFRILADLRLAAALLLLVAVASGVATFVESHYTSLGSTATGRNAAYDLVYDAWWFNALLVALFVNLVANLVVRLARGRQEWGFLLVHVGMIVILAGAGVTRWFGFEGYLSIREGQANDVVESAQDHLVVRQGGDGAAIPVRLYAPGEQDVAGEVTVGGQTLTIGALEFWPRFERRMVPAPNGPGAVVLQVPGGRRGQTHTLREGGRSSMGETVITFHEDGLPPGPPPGASAESRYGTLLVRVDGQSCRLPLQPVPGDLGECAGWRFALSEVHSDFRVGRPSGPDGPLINPMIRLEITAPDGEVGERMLFARHPEFTGMHGGGEEFPEVELIHQLPVDVDIAVVDGEVRIRAAMALAMTPWAEGGLSGTLEAGEVAPLVANTIYQNDIGLSVVPVQVMPSAQLVPAHSSSENAPQAARMFLEKGGQRAQAICINGREPQTVELAGQTYELSYGSVTRKLPYSLYLVDFVLETHPGTSDPASYESYVVLRDQEDQENQADGGAGEGAGAAAAADTLRIWMNNPLNYRGAKHFQSSYHRDLQGTILSVNQDPGKWPTYIGYTIISLGFLVVFGRVARDRIRARGVRQRTAPRGAGGVAAVVLAGFALAAAAGSARAQMPGHDHGHAHPQDMPMARDEVPPPVRLELGEEVRDQLGRLIVQDHRGRMKPLDTLARETVLKVAKTTSFEDRHPLDNLVNFFAFPERWWVYPSVVVKNPGVQELIGLPSEVHHVSLADVTVGGHFKFERELAEATRTSPRERNKTAQKLILFRERTWVLEQVLSQTWMRIYPIPDDSLHTWGNYRQVERALMRRGLGPDDPLVQSFATADQALLASLAMPAGTDAERAERDEALAAAVASIADLQQQHGADVLPAQIRVDAEMQLNSLRPFIRSTLPYMGGFLLLIVAYFWALFRRGERPWRLRDPLYGLGMLLFAAGFALHTYGFVLRWIASGRAPLSNGHESLLWVALAVGLAGLVFELASRTAAAGDLGSLLAAVVLGVSFMSMFDPAIGPLVPVLASYWLNIHVTIITASYGFLGLCALLGGLTLVLLLITGTTRRPLGNAIAKLDRLNVDVMIVGLGLLAVGTLLGGVWANESWGRYWGWDPKETWALVSILVYALILHFRWIPRLSNVYVQAAGSFVAIWSIIMTYFGVNYLLSGLHSYAAGEKVVIPTWVYAAFLSMLVLCLVGWFAWRDSRPLLKARSEALASPGDRL